MKSRRIRSVRTGPATGLVCAALMGCGAASALGQSPTPAAPPVPTAPPAATPAVKTPLVVVGSQTQAVGTVSPLDFVRGSFTFRNVTDKPVTVTKVEAGCRCTYGVMTSNTIAPGGEAKMNYDIDVRGSVGPLRKPISLLVAGFDKGLEVVVQGELQYAVRCNPPTLQPNGSGEAQVTLTSSDGVPFRVMSVNGEEPIVVSRNPAEGPKALSWTIVYNVGRAWPYAVVVETDHPKAPVLDLRVFSSLVSNKELPYFKQINDLAIGRHMVNLGVVKPGGSAEFDMYITRVKDYDQPVTLATDGGDIKLELVETFPWHRPDDTGLKIRAKFKEGMTGTKLFPVYVTSNGKTNRTWACAVLREEGASN